MGDLFNLDIPIVRVPPVDYEQLLKNCDPEALMMGRGEVNIFPEEPLPINSKNTPFTPTRDILSVLP